MGGYRYTAFGQLETADSGTPTPTIDQALRWKGRWFVNVAGGLYDVRARWWSPQLGAFLSVDDFGYHDRNSTLWGWATQNPIRLNDPSGRCPACLAAAGGALVGAGIGWLEGKSGGEIFNDALAGGVGGAVATLNPFAGGVAGSALGDVLNGQPIDLGGAVVSGVLSVVGGGVLEKLGGPDVGNIGQTLLGAIVGTTLDERVKAVLRDFGDHGCDKEKVSGSQK